jgi:hypothetical protein
LHPAAHYDTERVGEENRFGKRHTEVAIQVCGV